MKSILNFLEQAPDFTDASPHRLDALVENDIEGRGDAEQAGFEAE